MPSTTTLKAELFSLAADRGIRDPLSGCAASSERALTGVLCFYGQSRTIDWRRVPLYSAASFQEQRQASELISNGGCFLSEHVLLHRSIAEEAVWGGMPADIIYVSDDLKTVVMFENKVGSEIGYDPTPERNQLARQLDYLVCLRERRFEHAALIVVSGRGMLDAGWYKEEFLGALGWAGRNVKVGGYFALWEDIFNAVVGPNQSGQLTGRGSPA